MNYIKKIHYLDYYENGNKGKALGHIVWQEYDGKCELYVNVSKLERLFMGQASVLLLYENSTQNIGILEIKDGHAEKEVYIGCIVNNPIGVRISLTSDKWLEVIWKKKNEELAPVSIPEVEKSSVESVVEPVQFKEDMLYEFAICHPFGNDEEFYSVEMDALRKVQEIRPLENNSFLLHGYYNYRHLIMRKNKNGSIIIGVPGVYYEREKKVASMYGFDTFRGVKNAECVGCFGYYMQEINRHLS